MSKVLVLGAGASFGHGVKKEPRPPLSGGFFNHPLSESLGGDYEDLFKYISDSVGTDVLSKPNQDIEQVFARVESGWKLSGYQFEEALSRFGIAIAALNPIDMLYGYLVDMIYLSTQWLRVHDCPYHTYLCTDWLEAGDTVISFNYDLIIDRALKNAGLLDESFGYGFTENKEVVKSTAHVLLLKPHGSLNWFQGDEFENEIRSIVQRLGPTHYSKDDKEKKKIVRILPLERAILGKSFKYSNKEAIVGGALNIVKPLKEADASGNTKNLEGAVPLIKATYVLKSPWLPIAGIVPLIVFPTPYKSMQAMTFAQLKQVWRHARRSLADCEEVLAIGFSFRDEHFNQLIIEASCARLIPLKLRVVTRSREDFHSVSRRLSEANLQIEHINAWLEDFIPKNRL